MRDPLPTLLPKSSCRATDVENLPAKIDFLRRSAGSAVYRTRDAVVPVLLCVVQFRRRALSGFRNLTFLDEALQRSIQRCRPEADLAVAPLKNILHDSVTVLFPSNQRKKELQLRRRACSLTICHRAAAFFSGQLQRRVGRGLKAVDSIQSLLSGFSRRRCWKRVLEPTESPDLRLLLGRLESTDKEMTAVGTDGEPT